MIGVLTACLSLVLSPASQRWAAGHARARLGEIAMGSTSDCELLLSKAPLALSST